MTFTARILSYLRASLPLVLLTTGACSGAPAEAPATPLTERNAGGLYARGCPDGRDLEVSFADRDGELEATARCVEAASLRPDRAPRPDRLPLDDQMRPDRAPRPNRLPIDSW